MSRFRGFELHVIEFDNVYKDIRRQMTYHLVKLADDNRLTSGDSHALWYPFFGKAVKAFPDYKPLQQGVKDIRKGKKTTTQVLHEIADNIRIYIIGMRGKTLFNWKASHILPTIVYHLTKEDFFTRGGIYLKISEPPYEIFEGAYREFEPDILDSQNAVSKVVRKLNDKEIMYDCKDVLRFRMCGASIDNVKQNALLGYASTEVESLYESLLFSQPTDDGTPPKKANAVIVGKFIQRGQIDARKTLTGGIEVYQLAEIAPGKYKITKVKLEELTKHYNQYFVPTLNLDRDVLSHSVNPEEISKAIVYGTSGGEIRLTENARIFTNVLHAVGAESPKIKTKFIDELRKGGGAVEVKGAVLNVVQPFSNLETGEISTYSQLLVDSTIHYLLAGADPLAVLLTGYDTRNPRTELKGVFGSTTIGNIETCLQDLTRLFKPDPIKLKSISDIEKNIKGQREFVTTYSKESDIVKAYEAKNYEAQKKADMWQYLLDNMVVKVDSEDAYEVAEAYFKIFTNLLYYQAAYKRITDMFDLPQTVQAPPAQ